MGRINVTSRICAGLRPQQTRKSLVNFGATPCGRRMCFEKLELRLVSRTYHLCTKRVEVTSWVTTLTLHHCSFSSSSSSSFSSDAFDMSLLKNGACLKAARTFTTHGFIFDNAIRNKLTWLVLGGDPAARSHRVEQFTAL